MEHIDRLLAFCCGTCFGGAMVMFFAAANNMLWI